MGNPTGTNFPIPQYLHHLLCHMVSHSKLQFNFSNCYPSVLSDELINLLLFVLSCSSPWSTTARLISHVHVSILKMFHPPSDTASMDASISLHTMKSLIDDSCQVSLFHKLYNDRTMTKTCDSHFLAVCDGNV
jgi:hypothetical protein